MKGNRIGISKYNNEQQFVILPLPPKYRSNQQWYCLDMLNAETILDQLNCIKKTFSKALTDGDLLQFLCDIYFDSPPKHPVRLQIFKFLKTESCLEIKTIDNKVLVNSLAISIQQLLDDYEISEDFVYCNKILVSLSSCYDNFKAGLKALENKIHAVFSFSCLAIDRFVKRLSIFENTTTLNEFLIYIHNFLRFMLYCIQEFRNLLNTENKLLQQLNINCRKIIEIDDISMDARTNAGTIMIHIARLLENYQLFLKEIKRTKDYREIVLCVGIINTCNQIEFNQYSSDIVEICCKICEISTLHITKTNIVLCAARALYQLTKFLLQTSFDTDETINNTKKILQQILLFIFAYLEHNVDNVRYICRDLVRFIITIAKKIHFDKLLENIYNSCNSNSLALSMKCMILKQASNVLGAEDIITKCLGLFTEIFATHLGRDYMVNNLFESLMLSHYKEISFAYWLNTWIKYLLAITASDKTRSSNVEILIVEAVKCDVRVLHYIIECETYMDIPISTKLSVLWTIRKSGLKLDNFNETMKQLSSVIKLALISNNNDTRLMALRLLIETHKTTEALTLDDYKLLVFYMEYNLNEQSASIRHQNITLLSKALLRCSINLEKALKTEKETNNILELKFIQKVVQISVNNLFNGANYSRRFVSLHLLEQCIGIIIKCNLNLLDLLPNQLISILSNILNDPYEMLKEMALSMLKLIKKEVNYNWSEPSKYLKFNLDSIRKLLSSTRPADSVTAAYQLDFLCDIISPSIFGQYELPSNETNLYATLKWLLQELKQGLNLAQLNIIDAAKCNPLYGILFAIRRLLNKMNLINLAEDTIWRIVIADLISLCKEASYLVSPIVNNSSPEGFLPNDFNKAKTNLICKQSVAQLVLICAWRTVKEISLILGELVLRSPIQIAKSNTIFLINKSQILHIGVHFQSLLMDTKHRGAFEQAYVGFSKLCYRLWNINCQDLNSLPFQWLEHLINLISDDPRNMDSKMCATRRSAGVPFLVQALVTAEVKNGSVKSLQYCMNHLLKLSSSGEKSSESRIHALNILRTLFRCSDLNEVVTEFISEGVKIAINAYNTDNWMEKNSATLLFAALVTRIFGVSRTKNTDSDKLSVRNKMTVRVFFLRYPNLKKFILNELEEANRLIKQEQKVYKLQPLLLLLSRLYPSNLDDFEYDLNLSIFYQYLKICTAYYEMQTRKLAVKAAIAFISDDKIINTILIICSELKISKNRKFNEIHGNLLQIFYLMRNYKSLLDMEILHDVSQSLVQFYQTTKISNEVLLSLTLDIFVLILNELTNLKNKDTWLPVLLYFNQLSSEKNKIMSKFYPIIHKSYFMYMIHIKRLTRTMNELCDYMINRIDGSINDKLSEQIDIGLNIIFLILIHDESSENLSRTKTNFIKQNFVYEKILDEFEIGQEEFQFVKTLSKKQLNDLYENLRKNQFINRILKELIEKTFYYPEISMKCYSILSLLSNFDLNLLDLMENSKNYPSDIKFPFMLCLQHLIQNMDVDFKQMETCLRYLLENAQTCQSKSLRYTITVNLVYLSKFFYEALDFQHFEFVQLFINIILLVLMDDDYEVRNLAAKIVLFYLTDNKIIDLVLYETQDMFYTIHQLSLEEKNTNSTFSQYLFIQNIANHLANHQEVSDDYILSIFKFIIDLFIDEVVNNDNNNHHQHYHSINNNDIEIFEKNEEVNMFAEPMKILLDTIHIFQNTFKSNIKICQFIENLIKDHEEFQIIM